MSDEELLKAISSREFWRKYRNDEQNNNLDLYINYYKLIEEAGKLVKDLSLKNNEISVCYVISTLLKLGVFSESSSFEYEKVSIDKYKFGMRIATGCACCRHIADFTYDLLTNLEIKSLPYPCSTSKKNGYVSYSKIGDHVANLIQYNNAYYVYNMYYDDLLSFIYPGVARSNMANIYLNFRPYMLMTYYEIDSDTIANLIPSLQGRQIQTPEFLEIQNETLDLLMLNAGLIKDFNSDTKSLRKKIGGKYYE